MHRYLHTLIVHVEFVRGWQKVRTANVTICWIGATFAVLTFCHVCSPHLLSPTYTFNMNNDVAPIQHISFSKVTSECENEICWIGATFSKVTSECMNVWMDEYMIVTFPKLTSEHMKVTFWKARWKYGGLLFIYTRGWRVKMWRMCDRWQPQAGDEWRRECIWI